MPRTTPSFAFILAACALIGCAAEPDRSASLPTAPVAFKEADSRAPRLAAALPENGAWWKVFGDPVLDDLVERSDRGSWTIRLAAARLERAKAGLKAAEAARMPLVTANANASRQDGPLTNAAGTSGNLFIGSMNLSYEVDLFGRLAKETDAAALDAAERAALLRGARLVTQADVAQTYFSIRAIDMERAILRGAMDSQRETLKLMEGLVRSGLAAELATIRLVAETESIEAEARTLDRRRAELEHGLALLVGEPASGFALAETAWSPTLPEIPAGIPSSVLIRRPDVAAAHQAMLAAQKRVGAARDSWLPTLSLTGVGGLASSALTTLLSASSAGALGVGALLALPLFDGGRYQARVDRADAELDESVARNGQQILVAFKDVEDQLAALRVLRGQSAVLAQATASSARTTRMVESNYRSGLSSQLELLDARRSELRNRRQALQVEAGRVQATVGLVRALGGGWGDISDRTQAAARP
ncbi:MAG: efflux transporter outer membrane subunit [Alphaproteobacteria bacterium]|nr:efflux transporter outer membrane subunit [Alphaproteobacteria bacterium]